MNGSEPRFPVAAWWVLAVFLLAWNAVVARHAGPLTMSQVYDGSQYHLLARNRLQGHREVGDSAHTVRREGAHPIWRPGLVLLEVYLASMFGSVTTAAAAASALGTTLLQVAMLALAARHLGPRPALILLALLLLPTNVAVVFRHLAAARGPEVWSAAALVAGLAALLEATRRLSWRWALAAGALAGSAECFRTGSFLVFLAPIGVLALATLLRVRRLRPLLAPATAFAAYAATVFLAGLLVPSPVNKTAIAMGHRAIECRTPVVPHHVEGVGTVAATAGGLTLVAETGEAYNDYLVRVSHGVSAWEFFRAHQDEILSVYAQGCRDALASGARGLRYFPGNLLFTCFLFQLTLGLARRRPEDIAALALASGALAHYLGPILLLRGDGATHYLFVALPSLFLVGALGGDNLLRGLVAVVSRGLGATAAVRRPLNPWFAAVGLTALACWAIAAHARAVGEFQELAERATREQTDLDALGLEGHRVAVRNMSWFADRDIETVLLPYADAAGLAQFADAQSVDGILYWENEEIYELRMTPYDEGEPARDRAALERALGRNPRFGPPRASGGWRYFPVRFEGHVSRGGPRHSAQP